MTEKINEPIEEKSFAELFAETQLRKDFLIPGQKVEAVIVKITSDWIFLDLGGKSEGYLNKAELVDNDGKLSVKEGDSISAYFLSSRHNEKLFTTKIGTGDSARLYIEEVWHSGIPIDGTVAAEIKGGFEIKLAGGMRGFCPYSQMGLQRVDSTKDYIGRRQSFRITEYKEGGRNIILSSRVLLEEQRKLEEETLKGTLKEGMIVKGTVVSLKDYGAFIDIGGLQGLLPVSAIGWERVENIHDHLSVGQEIEIAITGLDWEKNRISLSLKQLLSDPWDDVAAKYPVGTLHTGRVVRFMKFGAFVTLGPGIDGLIHISKLGKGRKINHPHDLLNLNETIQVQIDSIDRDQKRISLSMASPDMSEHSEGKSTEKSETDYRQYIGKTHMSMGSLGDIIKHKKEKTGGNKTKKG